MELNPTENEQKVKPQGQFFKLQDKDKVTIESKLIRINIHYLKGLGENGKDVSVACMGKECVFCKTNASRTEYLYLGSVNGEKGVIRLPASVFFTMNENERLSEIDKRSTIWVIGKTGQGLETKYSAVPTKPFTITDKRVAENTAQLQKVLASYADRLEQKYNELAKNAPKENGEVEDIVIPDDFGDESKKK